MRGCLGRRAALARARALTGIEGVCALVHQAGMLRHCNWAQGRLATSCVRVATGMSREHHRGPRVWQQQGGHCQDAVGMDRIAGAGPGIGRGMGMGIGMA